MPSGAGSAGTRCSGAAVGTGGGCIGAAGTGATAGGGIAAAAAGGSASGSDLGPAAPQGSVPLLAACAHKHLPSPVARRGGTAPSSSET